MVVKMYSFADEDTHHGPTDYDYDEPVDYGYEPVEPAVRRMEDSSDLPQERPQLKQQQQQRRRRSSLKTSQRYDPPSPHQERQRRASVCTGEKIVRLCNGRVVKRRTSISFREQDDIKPIEPVMDLTDAPPESLWMTPDEYYTSRQEVKQSRNPPSSLRHSWSSSSGQWLAALSSRMQVLELQDQQRTQGVYSDTAIRRAYEEMATPSRRRAEQLGARDYAVVKAEHRATKRSLRKTMLTRRTNRRTSM